MCSLRSWSKARRTQDEQPKPLDIQLSINAALNRLNTIAVQDLQRVALQRRYDTKFVCAVDGLSELLANIGGDYALLCDDGRRLARYQTQYFDLRVM